VDCTVWSRQAETAAKYLTKGSPLLVEGRLTYRTWDGPDGKKRSKLEVTVERFQFLGRPSGQQRAPASQDTQRQEKAGAEEQTAAPEYEYNQDVGEDTIPF
jgi:single-strand DNA-binding protein